MEPHILTGLSILVKIKDIAELHGKIAVPVLNEIAENTFAQMKLENSGVSVPKYIN